MQSLVSLTSADLLMHDDAGKASSLHLSTGEYSQSSDVGHSTDATVAHDTSSESSVQISNDVANWKSLSACEIDTIVLMGPQLLPKNLSKDKSRSFLMSIFSRKMPNGETVARDYLCGVKPHKAFSVSVVAYSRQNLHCLRNLS